MPSKKNVQITLDRQTLASVDRLAKPLGLDRSDIVGQALREWLRRRSIERFELEWITALGERPDGKGSKDTLELHPAGRK